MPSLLTVTRRALCSVQWNETFVFDNVDVGALEKGLLRMTVFDKDLLSADDLLCFFSARTPHFPHRAPHSDPVAPIRPNWHAL